MRPEEQDESGPSRDDEAMRALDPCQDAIATLYTYLDGELTIERRHEIRRHLDECSPCFQVFGFEAELKTLIAEKCHDEVPDSLRKRVAQALAGEDVPF